jgi:hypothetical protein
MNWILGISVYFTIAKIGVFGLGYGDLEKMFYGGISGPQAGILLIAKLAATTAVHTPRVGTRAPSSIEDGASRGVSPNARNRRSRGNSMNIWIVTGKEHGELSNSYKVFNSLTGQKVVVKKSADNSADPVFTPGTWWVGNLG